MPITGFWSYKMTGDEFTAHWTDVNADRSANSLPDFVFKDGYSLAKLTADVDGVDAAVTLTTDLENALETASGALKKLKEALREKLMEYREAVEYRLKGSPYVGALPDTYHPDANPQKTLKALDDMSSLWKRINADTEVPDFTPPLVLRENYALAKFIEQLAALRADYKAVTDADNDARLGRKKRDARLDPLRARFVEYREAIHVEYGPNHVFTLSLPEV